MGLLAAGGLGEIACSGKESEQAPSTTVGTSTASDATTTTVSSSGMGGQVAVGGQGGVGGASTAGSGGSGGSGGSVQVAPTKANCGPASGVVGKLKKTALAQKFNTPLLIVSPWGDDERQFVIERAGRVQLLKAGKKSQFLDISAKTRTDGEYGLLGIAFHPDYKNNGRFFVHYSAVADGKTTIEEYKRDLNNNDLADPKPVGNPYLLVDQPAPNHNGGTIEFSPKDGYLYIALGDGGGGCDTYKTGQNLNTLLAKILRIDVSSNPYKIPPGNFQMGKPEIFITGLRNPYRAGFDVCTGDFYIGDVGQGRWEEIDVAPAGKTGLNFGWNMMEGTHCFDEEKGCATPKCNKAGLDLPVVDYFHDNSGKCSVTGGRVYRGHAIPWLRGHYFYADYCTGHIWSFRYENGQAKEQTDRSADLDGPIGSGIVGFGEDNQGELYIVTMDGTIYRIDPE
jgi:glucose/arabinose dehydrogenase